MYPTTTIDYHQAAAATLQPNVCMRLNCVSEVSVPSLHRQHRGQPKCFALLNYFTAAIIRIPSSANIYVRNIVCLCKGSPLWRRCLPRSCLPPPHASPNSRHTEWMFNTKGIKIKIIILEALFLHSASRHRRSFPFFSTKALLRDTHMFLLTVDFIKTKM